MAHQRTNKPKPNHAQLTIKLFFKVAAYTKQPLHIYWHTLAISATNWNRNMLFCLTADLCWCLQHLITEDSYIFGDENETCTMQAAICCESTCKMLPACTVLWISTSTNKHTTQHSVAGGQAGGLLEHPAPHYYLYIWYVGFLELLAESLVCLQRTYNFLEISLIF